MSTRANIIIKDKYDKLFFYRHSDGYPEGTMPTLELFLSWVKEGKIRDNVGQAAGWLIVIGAIEYNSIPKYELSCQPNAYFQGYGNLDSIKKPKDDGISGWRVGAYEPTTSIHGDIEYLYVIDLDQKTITIYDEWTDAGEGKHVFMRYPLSLYVGKHV